MTANNSLERVIYWTFSFPLSSSIFSLSVLIACFSPFDVDPPMCWRSSSSSMIGGIHIFGLKLWGLPRMQDRMKFKNRSPYSFGGTAEIQCYHERRHERGISNWRRDWRLEDSQRLETYFIILDSLEEMLESFHESVRCENIDDTLSSNIHSSSDQSQSTRGAEKTHEIINNSQIFVSFSSSSHPALVLVEQKPSPFRRGVMFR